MQLVHRRYLEYGLVWVYSLLSLCVAFLGSARAQELPVFSNEKTQLETACARTIEAHLLKPATSGDIAETCDCIDKAVTTANWIKQAESWPPEYGASILRVYEGEDYFYFYGIRNVATSSPTSLVVPEHRIIAQDLSWDVRACWAPHVLDDTLMFSGFRPDETAKSGKIAAVTDGPASSRVRGVGGLFKTQFTPMLALITNAVAREKAMARERGEPYDFRDPDGSAEARNFIDEIGTELAKTELLSCAYVTQGKTGRSRGITSKPIYYWYEQMPPGFDALVSNLSPGNPIRQVTEIRTDCPPSQPQ